MPQDSPGRHSDQYPMRFPDGMRDKIKAAAKANHRSMNAEIVARLEADIGLRDYFAAQMMPVAERVRPFAGAKDSMDGTRIPVDSPSGMDQLARWRKKVVAEAYAIADAMLAERAKETVR